MIRTKGLSHINLNVSDIERSARFYQEIFGLELLTAAFHADGGAARAEFASRAPVGRVGEDAGTKKGLNNTR
jgi:catechol 2,3-dioxygenase-like lactoylglutathione lyase family enzyme